MLSCCAFQRTPDICQGASIYVFELNRDQNHMRLVQYDAETGSVLRTVLEEKHEKYVEPSKKHANLVVPEGGKNYVALDMILSRIQRHLDKA